MATRAQIARLQQRIEQAAAAFGQQAPIKVVQIIHDPRVDETEDAALERHLTDHPEDRAHIERRSERRSAWPTLIICRIVSPKDVGTDGHKNSN